MMQRGGEPGQRAKCAFGTVNQKRQARPDPPNDDQFCDLCGQGVGNMLDQGLAPEQRSSLVSAETSPLPAGDDGSKRAHPFTPP
jgi:hypothetical protein